MDKIFCGSGRKIEFKNGGNLHAINLCLSDLPKEHITEYQGKKYIKLKLCKKQNVVEGKPAYYVEVDTWTPTKQAEQVAEGFEEPKENNDFNF